MALAALLVACGGGAPPDRAARGDSAVDTTVAPADVTPDTTYPPTRRGALMAHAALPGVLSGEWRPVAGVCGDPPSFQLLARGDSIDLMILVRVFPDRPPAGAYGVAPPEDTTAAPGAARIGIQRASRVEGAYRGRSGVVELTRLDRLASGRFDVVLRELASQDTLRYLGVFDRIRVDSLSAADCQAAPSGVPPEVH